jgi:hypothetical protein
VIKNSNKNFYDYKKRLHTRSTGSISIVEGNKSRFALLSFLYAQ